MLGLLLLISRLSGFHCDLDVIDSQPFEFYSQFKGYWKTDYSRSEDIKDLLEAAGLSSLRARYVSTQPSTILVRDTCPLPGPQGLSTVKGLNFDLIFSRRLNKTTNMYLDSVERDEIDEDSGDVIIKSYSECNQDNPVIVMESFIKKDGSKVLHHYEIMDDPVIVDKRLLLYTLKFINPDGLILHDAMRYLTESEKPHFNNFVPVDSETLCRSSQYLQSTLSGLSEFTDEAFVNSNFFTPDFPSHKKDVRLLADDEYYQYKKGIIVSVPTSPVVGNQESDASDIPADIEDISSDEIKAKKPKKLPVLDQPLELKINYKKKADRY